uniref:Uncharacterized protein n=1 Tax=Anguilla anguilla TaxID=7936 RepID=A0A0E9PWT0_ANGAN
MIKENQNTGAIGTNTDHFHNGTRLCQPSFYYLVKLQHAEKNSFFY